MNKLGLALILSLFSVATLAQTVGSGTSLVGQDSTNKVITTAVPFLGITPDARAAGMGDTGAATSPDANAGYWNSAKLVHIDKGYGVSMSYTPWLAKIVNDMYIFYLSGFYKIDDRQVVAASMKYFDYGEVQFNKGPVYPVDLLGRYSPRDLSFDVTYSRKLTQNVSIGGALRYIYSNLTGYLSTNSFDAQPGHSVAADIGFYYTKPIVWKNSQLSLGATITNIGAKITYSDPNSKDFIPTNLRIGGAYTMELDAMNKLTFALDFNKLMVPSPGVNSKTQSMLSGMFGSFSDAAGGFSEEMKEITISTGTEYWYNETFAGRLGYFYESREKGNRQYLTAGIGTRFNKFGLDVAYMVPTNGRENALAETLRFTIMMMWDKKVKQEESNEP